MRWIEFWSENTQNCTGNREEAVHRLPSAHQLDPSTRITVYQWQLGQAEGTQRCCNPNLAKASYCLPCLHRVTKEASWKAACHPPSNGQAEG